MRIAILTSTLVVLVAVINPTERPPQPVYAEQQAEQHKVPKQTKKPVEKPRKAQKVNDPQGCEPEQYWAKEPPHNCIDKPKEQVATVARSVATPSGSCSDWMTQAGITDRKNAYELIMRESGCNPNAVNPSSGACGIPQALPCSKMPGFPGDPVAQLRWMQDYVNARYGGWPQAWAFWQANNWY